MGPKVRTTSSMGVDSMIGYSNSNSNILTNNFFLPSFSYFTSYFTDLAEELPDDTLILTLGCAKNRVIHSEKLLGATLSNGMPRVMDMGQCNDSYSAVVVATELAKALNCGVNDLPLSLALSHLEQKAAAVLLTLLHLGVKNIRLGPSLPAYVTPNVLQVLVDNYNIMPTGTVAEDVKNIMQGK